MSQKLKLLLSILFLSVSYSCSLNETFSNTNQSEISSVKSDKLKFRLIKPENIPVEIIKITNTKAQEISDKESKKRDIDFFNIPKNPIGLEILSGNQKTGYILNYIGTSKNTEDVNVEIRAFYSEQNSSYSLNYSGPLTNSVKSFNSLKNETVKSFDKKSSVDLDFELMQGLPPEYIVKTFESYLNILNDGLKRFYQPKSVFFSTEDTLIYAIIINNEVKGFFFESHFNKVILGERKYADLQIGVMISDENEILGNYSLVAFNPKTKVNEEPVYKYLTHENLNIIETGKL